MTSETVLEELERVLIQKIGVPERIAREALDLLREHYVEPVPESVPEFGLRDRADARTLASAQAAGADVFVTGDAELLDAAGRIDRPRILSPRGFWALHRQ